MDMTGPRQNPLIRPRLISIAAPEPFAIFPPLHAQTLRGAAMAHDSEYQPGSMDISAHKKTYEGFLTGSKWTFGFIVLIMIFLAIFRTH